MSTLNNLEHAVEDDASRPPLGTASPIQARDTAHSRTLLPAPVANAVSFATRSTRLVLQIGTFVGGYGFDAAKFTTLSSLELGRGMLEGILARAGHDTVRRSRSDLGRDDAESILEKSLENLHRTINSLVFWTNTGFNLTGRTLSTVSGISQILLSTLDQFFGSTDSSRAIASIITLIRREFQNPASGMQGERVTVVDLVLGLCGLSYLQSVCSRLITEENRTLKIDEVVWDIVVLSSGERADVHEDSLYGIHRGAYRPKSPSPVVDGTAHANVVSGVVDAPGWRDSDDEANELPETRLKRQIMRSLPQDAEVNVTTSIATTKTITVDIRGTRSLIISPPAGVKLVEDTRDRTALTSSADGGSDMPAAYRIVYEVNHNKQRSTSYRWEGGEVIHAAGFAGPVEDANMEESKGSTTSPPPVPPKSPPRGARPFRTGSTSTVTAPPSPHQVSQGSPTSLARAEQSANQKRPRMPPPSSSASTSSSSLSAPPRRPSIPKLLSNKPKEDPQPPGPKPVDKKGGFRSALRRGAAPALSNLLHKEDSGSEAPSTSRRGKQRIDAHAAPVQKFTKTSQARAPPPPPRLNVPGRNSSLVPKREAPHPPPRGTRPDTAADVEEPFPRASSRASYISIHERRRDSIVSQTDTYSIHAKDDYRPVTPTLVRTELRTSGGSILKSRPDWDGANNTLDSPLKSHRRVQSQVYTPSIYTLKTNDSQSSLVPYNYFQPSAFGNVESLDSLRRNGLVEGIFPKFHILRNITRYMRFASASYGSSFLRGMGMAKMPILRTDDTHYELQFFAHHTRCEASSILLSSFVDQQGGSDGTGSTNSGIPLVHYISLDHQSKAVVLACRGTLGFEDVLADLTCDYDDIEWRGSFYKVHKGIHASARRLLYGGDGRVLATLKGALDEFTDYGLVLTGHSLGAAVTTLLGIMLSEPATVGTSFITSPEPHAHSRRGIIQPDNVPGSICLPSGRPIHVYAYGPPATMSATLSRATRGLVTSIVNGNDLVPYLSLGVLRDFQAIALGFKSDNSAAKMEVKQRIWEAFQTGFADRWYSNRTAQQSSGQDDAWAYAALKVLRANMLNPKLVPPGEVFVVESTKVLRREAFLLEGEDHLGRPARRIVLRHVRDVEKRFGEVRFGMSMLIDHSPGRYEDVLDGLRQGIMADIS